MPAATGSVAAGAPMRSPSAEVSSLPAIRQDVQLAALPQLPPAAAAIRACSSIRLRPAAARLAGRASPARGLCPPLAAGAARACRGSSIVVGGLGLSQTGTQKAIETLPEDVTLAFAPYGSSLQRWVDKAREDGHEVLLQIPLEPIDYPQENPGEHTLLVSGGAAQSPGSALGARPHDLLCRRDEPHGRALHQRRAGARAVPRRDRRARALLSR